MIKDYWFSNSLDGLKLIIIINSAVIHFDITRTEGLILQTLLGSDIPTHIHELARVLKCNVRDTYSYINELRQKGLPILGNQSGVHISQDIQEINKFIAKTRKKGVETVKMYNIICNGLQDTINKTSNNQMVQTQRQPWIKRFINKFKLGE